MNKKNIIVTITLLIYSRFCIFASSGINSIKPSFYGAQFAGYTGVISLSTGYYFFENKAAISLLYGYSPKFITNTEIHSISLKGTYYFKKIAQYGFYDFYPVINASVMCEPGTNSELIPSQKYPKGYYLTNSFNVPIGIGLATKRKMSENKKTGLEYNFEVCTLTRYLYYYAVSKGQINPGILSISLSFKIYH